MNSRPGPQSYYDILGISPSATPEAIEQAFRARVREVRDLPGAGDRTHQLTIAYRALKNADKRRNYDSDLAGAPRQRSERSTPKSAFFASGAGLGAGAAAARSGPMPGGAGPVARAPEPAPPPPPPPMAKAPEAAPPPEAAPAAAQQTPEPPIDTKPLPVQPEPYADASPPPLRWREVPPRSEPAPMPEPVPAGAARPDNGEEPWLSTVPAEEEWAEEERPARRRTGLYALAALIGVGLLALLLLVGRDVGPGSSDAPGVQADAGSATPGTADQSPDGGELASASPAPEGGLLSNIFGSGQTSPDSPPPETAAAGEEQLAAGTEQGAETATTTEEAVEVASGGEEAGTSDVPVNAPEEVASAVPPPAAAPAPRVNRSAPARYLGGGLVNADNAGGRFAGSVAVRFTVLPNGRTAGCRVARSSGNPALDATTCNLLEQRLRFSPALNQDGQPVAVEVGSTYTWGRTPR